jgi:hypothetical protein
MALLRENIQELMNRSLYHHSRYVAAIAPTSKSLSTGEQWAIKTDTAACDAFKQIDDYLNTIQSNKAPNGGMKRPANDKYDPLIVLIEATKKRLAEEEAPKINEEETNRKIEKIRRNSLDQRVELQGETIRERALESSLDITNRRDTRSLDYNSTSFYNRPTETNFSDPPPRPLDSSTPFNNPIGATLPNPTPRPADHSGSGRFNWLSTMLCEIEITPFNGDPRSWRSFSNSVKERVNEVLPSNAQRIVALRSMLTTDVRQQFETMLRNPNNYKAFLSSCTADMESHVLN